MAKIKLALVAIMLLFCIAQSTIIYVPTPETPSIQEGIRCANPGDTVSVWGPPGQPPPYRYDENIDYLGKPIYVANRSYIEEIPGYPPSPEYVII